MPIDHVMCNMLLLYQLLQCNCEYHDKDINFTYQCTVGLSNFADKNFKDFMDTY